VTNLYESWCVYARRQEIEPSSKIAFGDEMEGKGFERDRNKQHGRLIRGIRLKHIETGGNDYRRE
jgi:hypothetical protein